jgi:hypothetical protein
MVTNKRMKNEKIFFLVLVLALVGVVTIIIRKSVQSGKRRNIMRTNKSENDIPQFETTSQQLAKLNTDLLDLLNQKTGDNMERQFHAYFNLDEMKIVNGVKTAMNGKLPFARFSMESETMDESIRNMHKADKRMFEILDRTGFLIMVGKLLATIAWTQAAKDTSKTGLCKFWRCTEKIAWGSAITWDNISGQGSAVSACII